MSDAVDALELGRFHLVVHDIGGPVGFELAAAMADRIASLTVLNTIVDVDGFRRPWSMEPFATPIGPALPAHARQAGVPHPDAPSRNQGHVSRATG